MIYKKISTVYLLFLVSMLCLACRSGREELEASIEEVQEILEQFESSDTKEMMYVVSVNDSGNPRGTFSIHFAKKEEDASKFIFYKEESDTDHVRTIVEYRGYVYQEENYQYNIYKGTFYDVVTESNLTTGIAFKQYSYDLKAKKVDGKNVFSIAIAGSKLKELAEKIIGQPIPDDKVEVLLEVVADSKTRNLETFNIKVLIHRGLGMIEYDILITVLGVDDGVSFEVPIHIRRRIDRYIQENLTNPDCEDNPNA